MLHSNSDTDLMQSSSSAVIMIINTLQWIWDYRMIEELLLCREKRLFSLIKYLLMTSHPLQTILPSPMYVWPCVCMLTQMRVLSSGSFPSACLSHCSLTFCNFCVSSLVIELFDNTRRRVESLFLVGALDRGAACFRVFPWRVDLVGGRIGTKR